MSEKTLKIQPIITTGYRPIKDGRAYDKYFPKASTIDRMIVGDRTADVDDVVEMMQKVVWKYRNDTKDIAKILKTNTLEGTITNIWNFLYHHIQYKLDTSGLEELRRPARLWHDKVGDCDDYAMAASSILTNLKISNKFRITKYGKPHFQHVYVIVPHAKGYYIIDPVLSQANYEKPFTEKKDFNMNLNGINVAVLEGFGNTDSNIIDNMLLNDIDLHGLGSLSDEQANQRMYKYLVSTRAFAEKNKGSIAQYENPESFIKSLDYAIKYWHTSKREQALSVLARNEERENQINTEKGLLSGFEDDYYDWDNIDGLSDDLAKQFLSQDEIQGLGAFWNKRKNKKASSTQKKARRKKFWGKVKTGLKKVGKALNRYNPGVAAIRGGILIALRTNMFGFKQRLKWAYATNSQLEKAKIKKSYAIKAKTVLAKVEKIFEGMGGKKDNLKKAILKGKKGQLTGIEMQSGQYYQEDLDGLGVISSAAMLTAATTVLGLISKIFKKEKLGKEEKVTVNSPQRSEIVAPNENPNNVISRNTYSKSMSDETIDYNTQSNTITDTNQQMPNVKPPNKLLKLIKDNPLYAAFGGVSILGLSYWGISSLLKNKKAKPKGQSSIAGLSKSTNIKRKSRKAKPKTNSIIKIEKLK